MVTEIPWGDGSGDKIYLSRNASEGDQVVQVSSDANSGAARTKVVTFTSGVGNIQRQLTINQAAGRVKKTLVVNFSAFDDDHSYQSISNISNAYKGTGSSSSYCSINMKTGNYAETWFYFKFDTSQIPVNAEIESISCSVRNYAISQIVQNNRFSSAYMTMSSGTTEKGTSINILQNYSNAVRTFQAGTWTAQECQDVRVKFYAKRTTTNATTNYAMRVYGGTLTITYYE